MLRKLESFGAKPASVPLASLEKSLRNLETITGKLPDDYRSFLLYFGASVLFDVFVVFRALQPSPWADENYDSLESLYGLNGSGKEYNIFEMAETYRDDFHNQWLPIGSSSGDNQICICLNGAMSGQIWFWDHEVDPVYNDSEVISGMSKIANTFEDFIDLLEIQDKKTDSSGVVYVKLDF